MPKNEKEIFSQNVNIAVSVLFSCGQNEVSGCQRQYEYFV